MKKNLTIFLLILSMQFLSLTLFCEELCGRYDILYVENDEYCIQNNVWGARTAQCIDVNGLTFTVTRADHIMDPLQAPASYPSIFKGCHWEECTTVSNMPIRGSEVISANISWDFTMVEGGDYQAVTEAWFKTTSTPGSPDGTELMLYLNRHGGVGPGGDQIDTINIAGAIWEVWYNDSGWHFVTYRRTEEVTSIEIDYRPFIDDAISRGYCSNDWYLMGIEAGYELWNGGVGLTSNYFYCAINGELPTPEVTPEITPEITPTPTPLQFQLGDVNHDNSINILDALLIAQYYVGLGPNNFDATLADTDCNGSVTIVDALIVAQFYVGLITSFC